jgi:parvulin-like peptidyl-prolyl isomerase
MTVNRFGGIDKFREKFKNDGITYQDAINYFTNGVIKEALIEKIGEEIEPPEDMMKEYYENSKNSFIRPAKVKIKHIIIPITDENKKSLNNKKIEEQKRLANIILEKIRNGENFEELRQQYSKDYYADTKFYNNGFEVEQGRFVIAKVFEDAAFKLKPGEVSDVVRTNRGFHIIKLISKTNEKQMSYEESKERMKRDLSYSAKINYSNELMKKWKKENVIEKLF